MTTCPVVSSSSRWWTCPLAKPRFGGAQLLILRRSELRALQLKARTGRMTRKLRKPTISSAMEVPDFLPATWYNTLHSRNRARIDLWKMLRSRADMSHTFTLKEYRSNSTADWTQFRSEEAVQRQLDALQINDQPYPDHGVEVMYRFAGFDPFQRSKYFGPTFDLGQFERFRRIFHHDTYRVLLCHKERRILSSLFLDEHCFKQRVWVSGARPGEEEIYELTLVQRVGGNWDGYWLTDSLHHDGQGITGGIAY